MTFILGAGGTLKCRAGPGPVSGCECGHGDGVATRLHPASPKDRAQGVHCRGNRFVLPDAHHRPARVMEQSGGFDVARPIARQLLGPPSRIVLGRNAVLGATVPEASVHHDRDLLSGEGDVDGASGRSLYLDIEAVAVSGRVQGSAK